MEVMERLAADEWDLGKGDVMIPVPGMRGRRGVAGVRTSLLVGVRLGEEVACLSGGGGGAGG